MPTYVVISIFVENFQPLILIFTISFLPSSHYSYIIAIHCEWGAWVIGKCSAECGIGTRTNTRDKIVVEANGGTCSGETTEVVECMEKECPGKLIYAYIMEIVVK